MANNVYLYQDIKLYPGTLDRQTDLSLLSGKSNIYFEASTDGFMNVLTEGPYSYNDDDVYISFYYQKNDTTDQMRVRVDMSDLTSVYLDTYESLEELNNGIAVNIYCLEGDDELEDPAGNQSIEKYYILENYYAQPLFSEEAAILKYQLTNNTVYYVEFNGELIGYFINTDLTMMEARVDFIQFNFGESGYCYTLNDTYGNVSVYYRETGNAPIFTKNSLNEYLNAIADSVRYTKLLDNNLTIKDMVEEYNSIEPVESSSYDENDFESCIDKLAKCVRFKNGITQKMKLSDIPIYMLHTQNNIPVRVVFEVEKITKTVYESGGTSYGTQSFILLDIYPKKYGTVNITYGGLTKTITDTTGANSPNAKSVFFGTYRDYIDDIATPDSGALIIEGDCRAVAAGSYQSSGGNKATYSSFSGILEVLEMNVDLEVEAFKGNTKLEKVVLSNGAKSIGASAFQGCTNLNYVYIPKTVQTIALAGSFNITPVFGDTNINCPIVVNEKNQRYCVEGNCLIDKQTNSVISGFLDSQIPNWVESISGYAFAGLTNLTSINIPSSVKKLGSYSFSDCNNLTDIYIEDLSSWCQISFDIVGQSNPLYTATNLYVNGIYTRDVAIPAGTPSISNYAFYGFMGIDSVSIPTSVKQIGNDTFNGCLNLTNAYFEDTEGWYVGTSNDQSTWIEVDVTNPSQNATMLTETYKTYKWYHV